VRCGRASWPALCAVIAAAGPLAATARAGEARVAEAGVGLLAVHVKPDTPRTAPPPVQSREAPADPSVEEGPARAAAVGLSASLRFLQGDELVSEISDLRAAGVRYSREDMEWADIEPEPGRFDWSRWDGLVGASAQQGLRLIAIPIGSPAWATGAPNRPPVGDAASAAYAAFVRAAIDRYGTNGTFWPANPHLPRVPITMWDVWNEPYEPSGWGGPPDPAAYARLYRRTVQAGRDADPKARFLLEADTGAGGSGWPQPPFLEAMLASDAGLARDIDIVSVHPYSGRRPPQECTPDRRPPGREFWQATRFDFCRVLDIRRILDANGAGDARIWITEMGWSTAPQGERSVSEAQQAQYTRDAFDLLRRWRVVDGIVFYHYQLSEQDPTSDQDWYGLVRSDGTPKPAWYAFVDELRAGLQTAR
jgi:polysaccharide biosynthesis protein PslG